MTDLRGCKGCVPPRGQNSFNFMQFLGKLGKLVCWRPLQGLAPPPRGNPGSAIVIGGTKPLFALLNNALLNNGCYVTITMTVTVNK